MLTIRLFEILGQSEKVKKIEEIQNKNYVPNTFLLKIWDNIRDTQLF